MIRPARRSELARLAKIEAAAAERFRNTPMAFILDGPSPSPDAHAAALEAGLLFVAEAEGVPAGFLAAREMPGALHILEVSVHPDFGRRGLAGALLHQAVTAARSRNLPLISLTTDRDIPWNAPLWAKLGFTLAEADKPAWLEQMLIAERDAGFDAGRRVAMLRPA